MIPCSIDNFLNDLGARVGAQYTDEQKAFMSDFTSPIISFSSPGTGKTKSAIGGLLTAELYHQIPGNKIYALSFTNMATGELQVRHKRECESLGIRQTVNFKTLHSLCSQILKENHKKLGIANLRVAGQQDIESQAQLLDSFTKERGIVLHPWQVRPLIVAIRKLNSSLVFDRTHVESTYEFKQVKMSYEDFTMLRKFLYVYAKMTEEIQVQDILLYTLELLLKFPEVSDAFKQNCRILLVDEFQDLSLLQLRIITLLSDTVIAIGDIKQQIYAFNGACQEIVQEFKKYFPHARELNLNRSFRCATSIVNYSKQIIAPNNMKEEDFIGTSEEGSVLQTSNLNLTSICEKIAQDYRSNRNTFPQDILFLFRNNYSAIPVGEALYRMGVPFRINKYEAVNQIPVLKELCAVIELANNPQNPRNLVALRYILPEMKQCRDYTQSGIYKLCVQEGCTLFDVDFKFRNAMDARKAMELLLDLKDMLASQRPMQDLLNRIWPLFNEVYLREREPYLEQPSTYYIRMATPVVQNKTYFTFIQEEMAKKQIIDDCNNRRFGVRCYTFHASKGLEADVVYILDADEGVIPNTAMLEKVERAGCTMEKAREIRNERSLLFVAATRAKHELIISYSGAKTSMLSGINEYAQYDSLYSTFRHTYPDVEAFTDFYSGGL